MDHKMIASNLQALKVDVINLSHRLDTLLEEVERLAFIEAAQPSVQADDCPSCAGSGKKEIYGMLLTCLACDGTGNRR